MLVRDQVGPLRALHCTAAKALRILRLWKRRHDGRRELAMLTSCELRDIGISSCEAEEEIRKPFWRE